MGGYADTAFYNGEAYEGFSNPTVCLDGMAYYSASNPPYQGWYCINLYNGQTEYFQNNTNGQLTAPAMAQIFNYESPNQGGGLSYLWRTSGVPLPAGDTTLPGTQVWQMLDGYTGNPICKIANVSTAGTEFRDDIGSICYLNIVNLGPPTAPNYYMQIWNTTQAIWWHPNYGISPPATLYNGTTNVPITDKGNDYWMWRPGNPIAGQFGVGEIEPVYDGNNGYSMNISIASLTGPWNTIMVSSFFGSFPEQASIYQIIPDNMVIVGANGQNDARGQIEGFLRGISLAPGTWGKTLWTTTFTPPKATDSYPNDTYNGGVGLGGVSYQSGTFWFSEAVTGKLWVYSIATGQQLWAYRVTNSWSYFGTYVSFHDGRAYTLGPSGPNAETAYGIITCFNATTGQFLWNWTAPNVGYMEVQGTTYTTLALRFFIDDPVTGTPYIYVDGSHGWAGQTSPIERDGALICINGVTGQTVWRLEAYPNPEANPYGSNTVVINDGRIIYLDLHDDNIYCLGKGPSATTVSAPQTVPALSSSVEITGTVTDQTNSGRINTAGSTDFTLKGTPAISDASMEAWMEYMFQQRPEPLNATGVPVTLSTIDPNGNYIFIGNVTSDINGNYGCEFTPKVPGQYHIFATFAGSNAYGPSSASTYLAVGNATATPAPTAPPVTGIASTGTVELGVAAVIIVVVICVAVLAVLTLRKRP
jgi:hypothetical protein